MSPNGGASAAPLGGQQLVSDGVGVAAPAMARPRRFTEGGEARADESMGLPRRSRAPLVVLLAIDAGLAVAGALLLRAGLAGPAVASAAPRTEPSAPAAAAAPAEPPAIAAAKLGEGGEPARSAEPVAADGGKATAPPPSAEARPAAPEPAAPPKGLAPGEPEPGKALDQTGGKDGDQPVGSPTDRAADDVAAKKKKKDKRSSSAEGPVDPYAPAPDLSSQINKLFTKGQSKLDKCHASIARGQGPSQLTLSFRVMADGSLGGIRVLGAPAGAEMLGMCVTAELAKWKVQSGESGEFVRRIQFR